MGLARRMLTPEGVDQTVDRHHPVRTRQQQRQERPLQRSAELDDLPVPDHLERPKDPKLDADALSRLLHAPPILPQRGLRDPSASAWRLRSHRRIVGCERTPVTSRTPVEIGSDFLGYRVEELIGRGGMGVVYRAFDLRLNRIVALKLVTPELARDERFRRRFT